MTGTHPLRRLLNWLRRSDQTASEQEAQPAPIDPAVIQDRAGTVAELAGLSPAERIDRAEVEGKR